MKKQHDTKSSTQEKKQSVDIEKELEEKIEATFENFFNLPKVKYFFEAIFGALFTAIWLLIINKYWENVSFLTSDFEDILNWVNIAGGTSIALSGVLLAFRHKIIHHVNQIINNAFSFIITIILIKDFPFDFNGKIEFMNDLGKPILIILVILIILGILKSIGALVKGEEGKC